MINLILIILLIIIFSWREVQILIDRGSWKSENFKNLFWYLPQNNEMILWIFPKKNFDSFHVSNGIATLIIIYLIKDFLPQPFKFVEIYNTVFIVVVYWFIWMQLRNIFMHLVFRK